MSTLRLYPIRLLFRINFVRFYAREPTSTSSFPSNHATTLASRAMPHVPHEVHEKTPSINKPTPGGGGGGGGGSHNVGRISSSVSVSSSPLLDAALTTIVGLGMGKFLVRLVVKFLLSYPIENKLVV